MTHRFSGSGSKGIMLSRAGGLLGLATWLGVVEEPMTYMLA